VEQDKGWKHFGVYGNSCVADKWHCWIWWNIWKRISIDETSCDTQTAKIEYFPPNRNNIHFVATAMTNEQNLPPWWNASSGALPTSGVKNRLSRLGDTGCRVSIQLSLVCNIDILLHRKNRDLRTFWWNMNNKIGWLVKYKFNKYLSLMLYTAIPTVHLSLIPSSAGSSSKWPDAWFRRSI